LLDLLVVAGRQYRKAPEEWGCLGEECPDFLDRQDRLPRSVSTLTGLFGPSMAPSTALMDVIQFYAGFIKRKDVKDIKG